MKDRIRERGMEGEDWQRDLVGEAGSFGLESREQGPLLTSLSSHRQAMLHQEGHMDDALSLTRCQQEESQAARMIYSTAGLYNQFIK